VRSPPCILARVLTSPLDVTHLHFRCSPSHTLVPFFTKHLAGSRAHLSVPPESIASSSAHQASPFFEAQPAARPLLSRLSRLTLLSPAACKPGLAARHIAAHGYGGLPIELLKQDPAAPLPPGARDASDSVSAMYVLHCAPGHARDKAAAIAGALAPALSSADGAVLFGATVLGAGVRLGPPGRLMMRTYRALGVFRNADDDAAGLREGLETAFDEVQVDVVGAVAMFMCKRPKCRGEV
jgi:hypothetical protein